MKQKRIQSRRAIGFGIGLFGLGVGARFIYGNPFTLSTGIYFNILAITVLVMLIWLPQTYLRRKSKSLDFVPGSSSSSYGKHLKMTGYDWATNLADKNKAYLEKQNETDLLKSDILKKKELLEDSIKRHQSELHALIQDLQNTNIQSKSSDVQPESQSPLVSQFKDLCLIAERMFNEPPVSVKLMTELPPSALNRVTYLTELRNAINRETDYQIALEKVFDKLFRHLQSSDDNLISRIERAKQASQVDGHALFEEVVLV